LPADRGWWGFSFQDAPSRVNEPTRIIHIPNGHIIPYIVPEKNQFWPAVLNQDAWALELREMSFERFHRKVYRSRRPVRRARATWMLERVYRNYSHWLTAHLPKILLLRSRDHLAHLILPPASMRTDVIDDSLRLLGVDPEHCDTFDPTRPMEVEDLTIVDTDRFRPELLRSVRDALCTFDSGSRTRKVFISRAKASRRHVTNRKALWRLLQQAGFERLVMEDLSLKEQITCMQDVSVLVAPHGAGLANMMFCAPETHVVEIADSGFPNPNFYTLASAMKLHYWLIQAQGVGSKHPSVRDMHVPLRKVEETLRRLPL
jgi:capsular polysaccharide biosynthesis protein